MTLQNTKPLRFSPQGVSDALAEEDAFPGACSALINLVPDPSTKNLWTPRPASIEQTSAFSGFATPTGVSVFKIVGGYVFGLVSTALTAGYDQPFCFNLVTSAFVSVTGVTSSNVPLTQPTTGDWTPPTMDVVGNFVIVTHPGFDGVTNFIGWFDITVLTAPVWHAGNFTLFNPISTLNITFPGSLYTNGTYTDVALQGGTGAGATANVTVSGGAVTAITIVNGGVGYLVGDTVTVLSSAVGGTGSGFAATVASVPGSGIQALTINSGGNGYTSGTFAGVSLMGGSGTGATGTFVVVGGVVVGLSIDNPGEGYLVNDILSVGGSITAFGAITAGSGYTNGTYPNIPLEGGSGFGATANITVSGGAVTAVVLANGGVGYKTSDSLNLIGDSVLSVSITDPGNGSVPTGISQPYTPNATSGSGKGARFVFVAADGIVTSVAITMGGSNYTVGDILYFNFGITLTVQSVTAASHIRPGTGFAVAISSVSTTYGGSGFTAQVLTLLNPGGYINFTTIPSWVRQFNGRGWFGINPPTGIPSVIFTDVYALNCMNANQALSFGDNTPLTAAAPLGLANLLGGVIQSLIVFKSLNGIIQITGDATTNNLSVNQVPGGSGTISPRSLTEHPQGLLYLDHDGYRMVTLDGNCSDPIGVAGQGVVVPLINLTYPTRVNAACNGSVLRVSVLTVASVWQEYWFDSVRKVWSGPHSFPSTMIDVYENDFILASQSAPVGLWKSAVVPAPSSTFTEHGTLLTWTYQTVPLNDNMQMAQSTIEEMTVKTSAPTGLSSITVAAMEVGGLTGSLSPTTINTATFSYPAIGALGARRIDFNAPVVYNRLQIEITGNSYAGFRIGDIFVRVGELRYVTEQPV